MGDVLTTAVGDSLHFEDHHDADPTQGLLNFTQIYDRERDKRFRAEGTGQYIDLRRTQKYKKFTEDPWIEAGVQINTPVPNDGHCKIFVLGAGFGGILFAIRCILAGIDKDDILIVDPAGGFGGTWYWNRYPGLMCDVESHIYLPLIEEMDYMPKRRYASGVEIREYVESLCSKYGLHDRAMFQSSVRKAIWNESTSQWDVTLTSHPKGGEESEHVVHANFLDVAPGLLTDAKFPDIPGIDDYAGHMFHTNRWDYDLTGGSPTDPSLTGLEDKRVGIVGTGATCIQALPHLARHASKLYVFQRTPSQVDRRDNADTEVEWFKTKVATKPGWHRERNINFIQFLENTDPKPEENVVDDGWARMPSYSALIGTSKSVTMDNVMEHIGQLHALDYPRQQRIHGRVDDIVKDANTAQKLKPWYPSWCKRPCFHDEYLQSYNNPNVELVDTNGKGLDCVTRNGIRANGKDYDVDVIMWSTGFRSPALGSPASKAEISVIGKHGLDMEEQNTKGQLLSLHGCLGHEFPNLFWTGPLQAGATANNTFTLDTIATHAAYIIAQAVKKGANPVVEPTKAAVEDWAMQIMMGAATFAAISSCTPSYLNREGEASRMTPEQRMSSARFAPWPNGFVNYLEILERWRADGKMDGIEVSCAS